MSVRAQEDDNNVNQTTPHNSSPYTPKETQCA